MTLKYAFTPIAGQGLGFSYSSLQQLGSLLPSRGLGQANIQCYPNFANGNLVLQDHALNVAEQGDPLILSYLYNSQAASPADAWRLAQTKHISGLPTPDNNNHPATITLTEVDGHLTTYTYDAKTNSYIAPGLVSGTPYIYYDDIQKKWAWYHPGTHHLEYYNLNGILESRCDQEGRTTQFLYDSQNQLTAIQGPSGCQYQLRRNNNLVEIYAVENGQETLLQIHTFDSLGRLTQTQTPDGSYSIVYGYFGNTAQLTSVTQTDGTTYSFSYDESIPPRIKHIYVGNQNNNIQYDGSMITLRDSAGIETHFQLDDASRFSQLLQPRGYDQDLNPPDKTTYTYASTGQVASIQHPDGDQEQFQYDSVLGLLTKHIQPNGQVTEYYYKDTSTDRPKMSTQVHYLDVKTPLVTRYVYDDNYDGKNQRHVFLRFEISPEGRVTEYRPDLLTGNPATVRTYLANSYTGYKPVDLAPSLQEMTEWSAHQNPQQVSLAEFHYNTHGQPKDMRHYAQVDAQGNGIADQYMSQEITQWDLFNGWVEKVARQSDTVQTRSIQTFDQLHRLAHLAELSGKNQKGQEQFRTTRYKYLDSQAQLRITRPNGRVEMQQWTTDGLMATQVDTAQAGDANQTRVTTYKRDMGGRIVETVNPDQQLTFTFYDRQQRLGFTVSRTGIVEEYRYDRVNRSKTTVRYANPIDVNKLFIMDKKFLPLANTLEKLLEQVKDFTKDRYSYQFYDASNRLRYAVDADQYVTETQYDNLNRLTGKIAYADELSDANLQQLQAGQPITLTLNTAKDRYWRYYFDKDNKRIGKQDPAGYVTHYKRDASGHIIEKVVYFNPTQQTPNFVDIPTRNTQKDAHHYYFRNARGQCVVEIDAEGAYIQHDYLACGLKARTRSYLNKVKNWQSNTPQSAIPNPPVASTEDRITVYDYDLLNRHITSTQQAQTTKENQTQTINLKGTTTQYDNMDQVLSKQTQDLLDPTSLEADKARGTQAQYDGWEQVSAEANPFINQLLQTIEANPNYTPQQKAQKKAAVWEQQSTRHIFDATGLKLKSIDSLNNPTFYFYDQERRPTVTVNALGAITERTYNSFNEVIATRQYITPIPTDILATLTGGVISSDFQALLNKLKNPNEDAITLTFRNKRGLIERKEDPEQYVSTFQYTAFKECEVEHLPVNEKTPSLTVKHTFETRGLETTTVHASDDGQLTSQILHEYQNPLGKETALVNELGGKTVKDYNRLGQQTEQINPLKIRDFKNELDAFGRVKTEIDAENAVTQHSYNQLIRSHQINYPIPGYTKTEIQNVFGQAIKNVDANNNATSLTHAPHGDIHKVTDPLQNNTTTKFNFIGLPETIEHPNGSKDSKIYNQADQLIQECLDEDKLALITNYKLNAFGERSKIVNPKLVITENTFDRKGLNIATVIDPSVNDKTGLNITVTRTFNGQKSQLSENHGDQQNPNQYLETYQHDGLNRNIGKTIAPGTLNLQTINTLDAAGQVIKESDANGNSTFTFYNIFKQKRFMVDSLGGVIEWTYDLVGENRIHCERYLAHPINLSQINIAQITLAELDAIVIRDVSDRQLWTFRDLAGREQFHVNSQGQVTETVYDSVDNPIKTIVYATAINASSLPSLKTADVSLWTQTHNTNAKNRINYHLFDEAKNERYSINPRGYIVEKRYRFNKLIAMIEYATRLTDPAQIANLPIDKVDGSIPKNSANDRETWHIYDSVGRLWFSIHKSEINKATVTRFDHDPNGNLEQTCYFASAIDWPLDYDNLIIQCQALVPDSTKDRITKSEFDNANREIKKTNALGYRQAFKLDAVDNRKALIDEINSQFDYEYDNAKRKTGDILPPCDLTLVEQTQKDPHWALSSYEQKAVRVSRRETLDKVGNVMSITNAQEVASEKRVVTFDYDKRNMRTLVTIIGVALDDPSQNASWQTRPEKLNQTLTKVLVYDARKRKIAEKGFDDQWTFYLYDSEDREIYRVLPNKAVIGKTYDTFGDQITETKYANPITLDLTLYTKSGLPLTVLLDKDKGGLKPSLDDRTTCYEYNHQGKIELITKPKMPYFLSNEGDGQFGMTSPIEKQDYNAFDELTLHAELVDPQQNSYKRQLTWYSLRGKKAATCDAENGITRRFFNTFNQCQTKMEWALPPAITPTVNTSLAELDANYQPNKKDRFYVFTYDLNGDKLTKTLKNQVVQQLVLASGTNVPSLQDLPSQDLTQLYAYDPRRLKIAIKHEDNSIEYTYFNALKKVIAKTGVKRTTLSGKTLIPLTYFGRNAFGDEVLVTHFAAGTQNPTPNEVPEPLAIDLSNDQTELKLFDVRGLITVKQTAEGAASFYTYNAGRKIAREYYGLTETTPSSSTIHLDERRITYDALYSPLQTCYLRDNTQLRIDNAQYNAFNEVIAQGENGTYSESFARTANGKAWKHNHDKGAVTIELMNLQNLSTIKAQSDTEDLESIQLSDLPDVLNTKKWSYDKLLRTEKDYNLKGKMIIQRAPAYEQTEGPDNIPLNIYVGNTYEYVFGKVNLSWLIPKETNVTYPTIEIYPIGDPNNIHTLPIVTKIGRCGVDVSQLPSGIYGYAISYYLNTDSHPQIYKTTGQVQFESLSNKSSTTVVPIVENNNQIRLVGNTTGLTAVKVCQGLNNVIAEIPVIYDLKKQAYYADLSQLASGSYTITPVNNDVTNSVTSLPITIYTNEASSTPLSYEIDVRAKLHWLDTHAELIWQVPTAYAHYLVKFACVYIGTDNQAHIYEGTVTPGQYIKDYTDKNGRILHCNAEFKVPIVKVTKLDLVLVLDEQETLLPLLANVSPLPLMEGDNNHLISTDIIQGVGFSPRAIILIGPIPDPGQYKTLFFKDMQDDMLAKIKVMPILAAISPVNNPSVPAGIAFDATNLNYGNYPWLLGQSEEKHRLYLGIEQGLQGTFTRVQNGAVFSSDGFNNPSQLQRPIQHYNYDRWGNKTHHTNSLGFTTEQEFSGRNKVTKTIEPKVPVTDDHCHTADQNPITVYGYNLLNQQNGIMDPNKHTEGYVLNEAGQTIKHVLGDGTLDEQDELDIFGNALIHYDDQGKPWTRTFNRRNLMLKQITPLGRDFGFSYDELDHRISQSIPSGATFHYCFDLFGAISANYLPLGQKTSFERDRNHQLLVQTNADSSKLTWQRDYWSNPLSHIDLGGAVYTYKNNRRSVLVEEWSQGGNHGQGLILLGYNYDGNDGKYVFNVQTYQLPNKHLQYSYRGNWLVQATDLALQQISNYKLNSEGQRMKLTLTGPNQQVIRQISSQYDALGRDALIYDNQFTMALLYDAADNRRRMSCQMGNSGQGRDSWFLYDAANRFIIFDGVSQNNDIIITTDHGSRLTYRGNLRLSMESFITYPDFLDPVVEHNIQTLSWDNDSRLINAVTNSTVAGLGTATIDTESYQWDEDDWVKYYQSNYFNQDAFIYWPGLQTTAQEGPVIDANGWQRNDHQTTWQRDQDTFNVSTTYNLNPQTGQTESQTTQYVDVNNSDGNATDNLKSGYVQFETNQLAILSGYRTNKYGSSPLTASNIYYNSNGQLQATVRGGDRPALNCNTQTYENMILSAISIENEHFSGHVDDGSWDIYIASYVNTFYIHNTNGQILASYAPTNWESSKNFNILPDYLLPVSPSFPPRAPQFYVVQSGNTFKQLAARFYGDSTFAASLALRTGYASPDIDPSPGTVLSMPTFLPTHNQFSTYSSYNTLINLFMSNIYPSLHTPQPKPKHHSWWETVVECVVAAVILIAVPALAPFMIGAFSAFSMTGILVGAVAGAMAAAAQQGVAIALHDQSKFHWKSVFEGAVENVLLQGTAGLENINIDVQTMREYTLKQFLQATLVYGQANVETQLLEMSIGLRRQFNFNEVLESGISGATSQFAVSKYGAKTFAKNAFLNHVEQQLAENEISDLSSGVTAAIVAHQRFDLINLEAEALGSSLGTAVGASIEVKPTTSRANTSRANTNTNPNVSSPVSPDKLTHAQNNNYSNKLNQFGVFGGGKKTPNQSNYQKDRFKQYAEQSEFQNPDLIPTNSNSTNSNTLVMRYLQAHPAVTQFLEAHDTLLNNIDNVLTNLANSPTVVALDHPGAFLTTAGIAAYHHPGLFLEGVGKGAYNFLAASDNMVLAHPELAMAMLPGAQGFALGLALNPWSIKARWPLFSFNTPTEQLGGTFFNVASMVGGVTGAARDLTRLSSLFTPEAESGVISTGGRNFTSVHASLKADDVALKFYEEIRNSSSNLDVHLISNNTGMPKFQVQRIKQHLFFDTHKLSIGIERFSPDIEIVDAWTRLQNNNFVKQDLELLQHEYFEARFKGIFKTDYITAHNAANNSFRQWNPHEFITTPEMSWRP